MRDFSRHNQLSFVDSGCLLPCTTLSCVEGVCTLWSMHQLYLFFQILPLRFLAVIFPGYGLYKLIESMCLYRCCICVFLFTFTLGQKFYDKELSFFGSFSGAKLNGSRKTVSRRHREVMNMMIPTHVFKRRGISKVDLHRLASLTMNEVGRAAWVQLIYTLFFSNISLY